MNKLIENAEDLLEAAIEKDYFEITSRLIHLHNLEAFTLLGFLMAETLQRFSANERSEIFNAMIETLREGLEE